MKIHSILVGSVATLALIGAFVGASPTFAQSDMNPPQYSSPAEKAQTQQLNRENEYGTTQSPAALNGEPAAEGAAPSGYYGGEQQESDQQSQYDQQMQQYQGQQQQYQDQNDQYQQQKDRYDHNLSRYDQARWNYDYPRPYAYDYEDTRLERISLMDEPTEQLSQVPVEGPAGGWVGRIRTVEMAPDGRAARVEIALNRRVSVWVDSRNLRFDPDEHVAYTNLTRNDLWQMPSATLENGPM